MANIFGQNKSLFETSEEELKKQQQAAAAPGSPAAGAASGATPDSAKMLGSSANKQATIDKITTPTQQTLQQQQRYAPKAAPEPSTYQAAREKMDRLKQLGGIDAQVEGLIQQKLQQAQLTNITQFNVNQANVQANVEATKQEAFTKALSDYAIADTPEKKQKALADASIAIGRAVTESELSNTYFQGAGQILSQAVTTATPESIKMSDLDLSSLGGLEQIAADLGVQPSQLSNFTVMDVQKALQDVESREYNKIAALEAELPTAVGARREQIMSELGGMAQAGVTGVEAQLKAVQQQIDDAQTIDIAGENYSLKDILEDEEISSIIMDAVINEDKLKALEADPGVGGLAKWIRDNKAALAALSKDLGTQAEDFSKAQQDVLGLQGEVPANVFNSIVGKLPQFMTPEEVAAAQTKLASSTVVQAINSNSSLASEINTPEMATALEGKTVEEINALYNATLQLRSTPGVAQALGIDASKMLTSGEGLERINKYIEWNKEHSATITAMSKYIKNNDISDEQMELLIASPDRQQSVIDAIEGAKKWKAISTDYEKLKEFVFGAAISDEEVNNKLATLKRYSDMGSDVANKAYTRLKSIIGSNGVLGKEDLELLNKVAGGSTNVSDVLSGASSAISDVRNQMSTDLTTDTLSTGDTVVDDTFKFINAKGEFVKDWQNSALFKGDDVANLDKIINNKQLQANYPRVVEAAKVEKIARVNRKIDSDVSTTMSGLLPNYISTKGTVKTEWASPEGLSKKISGNYKDTVSTYKAEYENYKTQFDLLTKVKPEVERLWKNATGRAKQNYKNRLNEIDSQLKAKKPIIQSKTRQEIRKRLLNKLPSDSWGGNAIEDIKRGAYNQDMSNRIKNKYGEETRQYFDAVNALYNESGMTDDRFISLINNYTANL